MHTGASMAFSNRKFAPVRHSLATPPPARAPAPHPFRAHAPSAGMQPGAFTERKQKPLSSRAGGSKPAAWVIRLRLALSNDAHGDDVMIMMTTKATEPPPPPPLASEARLGQRGQAAASAAKPERGRGWQLRRARREACAPEATHCGVPLFSVILAVSGTRSHSASSQMSGPQNLGGSRHITHRPGTAPHHTTPHTASGD